VRLLRKAIHERLPIFDAVALDSQQVHVGSRTEQTVLQVLAEAVVDGQSDDEGGYSGGHTQDRNAGDDADDSLAALGAQVAGRDEEFEFHSSRWPLADRALSMQHSAFSQLGL
jgi:hypothetical protein